MGEDGMRMNEIELSTEQRHPAIGMVRKRRLLDLDQRTADLLLDGRVDQPLVRIDAVLAVRARYGHDEPSRS